MDQYNEDDMVNKFLKYKRENKIVQCVDKPSVLKLVGDLTNKTIIDYGCGFGFYAREFVKTAKKVIAVDYSQQMIELSKRLDKEAGVSGTEYHISNCAEDLNLGQHDITFSSYLLCHAIDRHELEKFLKSMYNSTRPGGICCGITYSSFLQASDLPFLRKYGYDIKLNKNPKEGDLRTIHTYDFRTGEYMFDIRDHYIAPEVIEETFNKAGFINFKWLRTSLGEAYQEEAEFLADYFAHPDGMLFYSEKPLNNNSNFQQVLYEIRDFEYKKA